MSQVFFPARKSHHQAGRTSGHQVKIPGGPLVCMAEAIRFSTFKQVWASSYPLLLSTSFFPSFKLLLRPSHPLLSSSRLHFFFPSFSLVFLPHQIFLPPPLNLYTPYFNFYILPFSILPPFVPSSYLSLLFFSIIPPSSFNLFLLFPLPLCSPSFSFPLPRTISLPRTFPSILFHLTFFSSHVVLLPSSLPPRREDLPKHLPFFRKSVASRAQEDEEKGKSPVHPRAPFLLNNQPVAGEGGEKLSCKSAFQKISLQTIMIMALGQLRRNNPKKRDANRNMERR